MCVSSAPPHPLQSLREATSLGVASGLQGCGWGGEEEHLCSASSPPSLFGPRLAPWSSSPVLSECLTSISLYPTLTAWCFDDLFVHLFFF